MNFNADPLIHLMKTLVKLTLIVVFIITTLFSTACKHEIPLSDKDTDNTDTCGITDFSYSGAVAPLMTTRCIGCHNTTVPSGGVILSTYDGVKAVSLNGRLLGSIKQVPGYRPMPLVGNKLQDCQIRLIEKWIGDGSKNN